MFMECPAGCSWNGWPDDVECAVNLKRLAAAAFLSLCRLIRIALLNERMPTRDCRNLCAARLLDRQHLAV